MTTTYRVDGTAGSDSTGNGSAGNPYKTIQKCAPSGTFADDDILLELVAGTTIDAITPGNAPFTTANNRSLTIRAVGGGARPYVNCTNRGFKAAGTGSLDFQDVDIHGSTVGNGMESKTGGSLRCVNTDIHGFATSIKCGTGTILLDGFWLDKPASNGFQLDAPGDQPIATSAQVLNGRCTAASPTQQDLLVFHDGGYGVLKPLVDKLQNDSKAANPNRAALQAQYEQI